MDSPNKRFAWLVGYCRSDYVAGFFWGCFGGILVEALGFGSGGQWNSSDEGGLLFEIRPYSVSDADQQIYFGNDINRHRCKSRPGRPDGIALGGIGFVRRSLVRLGSEAGDGVDSYGLLRGGGCVQYAIGRDCIRDRGNNGRPEAPHVCGYCNGCRDCRGHRTIDIGDEFDV